MTIAPRVQDLNRPPPTSAKTTPVPEHERQAREYAVEAIVAKAAAADALNTPSLIGRIVQELSRPSRKRR